MFETEKTEKRIKDLVQKIGTDFLTDEGVFRAVINDILFDLKLERTALINATSVHIGKIFLAANDLSYEEKRKAKNKAKDKLINESAFSEEGADFVVTVLSVALGWGKVRVAQIKPPSSQSRTTYSSVHDGIKVSTTSTTPTAYAVSALRPGQASRPSTSRPTPVATVTPTKVSTHKSGIAILILVFIIATTFLIVYVVHDTNEARQVESRISDIGFPVTLEDAHAITSASRAYDELTDRQRSLVKNRGILIGAMSKLEQLQVAEEARIKAEEEARIARIKAEEEARARRKSFLQKQCDDGVNIGWVRAEYVDNSDMVTFNFYSQYSNAYLTDREQSTRFAEWLAVNLGSSVRLIYYNSTGDVFDSISVSYVQSSTIPLYRSV